MLSSQDSTQAGLAKAFQFTAQANGTVNKLYVYLDTGSASPRERPEP